MHDIFTTIAFSLIRKIERAAPRAFRIEFNPISSYNQLIATSLNFNFRTDVQLTIDFDHRVVVIEEVSYGTNGNVIYRERTVYGSNERFDLWLHVQYLLNANALMF